MTLKKEVELLFESNGIRINVQSVESYRPTLEEAVELVKVFEGKLDYYSIMCNLNQV